MAEPSVVSIEYTDALGHHYCDRLCSGHLGNRTIHYSIGDETYVEQWGLWNRSLDAQRWQCVVTRCKPGEPKIVEGSMLDYPPRSPAYPISIILT